MLAAAAFAVVVALGVRSTTANAQIGCPATVSVNDVSLTEGTSAGTKSFTFTVSRAGSCVSNMQVSYATANDTAVQPSDYTQTTGNVTFTPTGSDTQTVSVPVQSDSVDEDDEAFRLNLTGTTAGTISDSQGVGTIQDDDGPPSVSASDTSVPEGASTDSRSVNFGVTLSSKSSRTITVEYATAPGTAASPSDYGHRTGTLTFAPGTDTKTVAVPIVGENVKEEDENFSLQLSNPTNATIGMSPGVGTILDDDPTPAASITDATVTESDSGTRNVTLTVSLTNPSQSMVSFGYATAVGTAGSGDFVQASGTVSFDPLETQKTIVVQVAGDTIDEADETFHVDLSSPQNATIADGRGTITITDDDDPPRITASDVTVAEGNSGTTTATFPVTLSNPSQSTVTVNYATANGTALEPVDYTAKQGTVTFAPGETDRTVTVEVAGDVLDEDHETFHLDLSGPVNSTIARARATATITDNDPLPNLSISDASLVEGNAGTKTMTFTVSLSPQSGRTVSVDYATSPAKAVAPDDYTHTSGTLTFQPGDVQKAIDVTVKGDLLDEVDEDLLVDLSGAMNASVLDGQGVGTITDDDEPPSVSVADVTVTEGSGGTTGAVFPVTLSAASGKSVTVQYVTSPGTASAPADYAAASGTLTFDPGQTQNSVSVAIATDSLDETDTENFSLTISNPGNATIPGGSMVAVGTITDDDAPPAVSVNDVTVTEPNTGQTVEAVFSVSLSAVSGRAVTVPWSTGNFTAVAPGDYTAVAGGSVTIPAGQPSATVSVTVNGDVLNEATEAFLVSLGSSGQASAGDVEGQGTITDNDPEPRLSISDASVTEGPTGETRTANFTVTLDAPSGRSAVTVDYSTANSSAVALDDYTHTSGTLSFAAGETSKTVSVTVKGDALDEIDETFTVNLANPTFASVLDGQGVGTVVDDDDPPSVSVGDVSVTEGTGGSTTASFAVALSAPSGKSVTVQYATSPGTAMSPGDFTAASGTLTFSPGQTSRSVAVAVATDSLDETDTENFSLTISNPGNATIPGGSMVATGTITDDDAPPTVSIADASATEPNSGQTPANFVVSLSTVSGRAVTVGYETLDQTAVAPADYASVAAGTATIPAGQSSVTVPAQVAGDLLDEDDETFLTDLKTADFATIARARAVGTINDNDPLPGITVSDASVTEGNLNPRTLNFTVTLDAPSGRTLSVGYRTAPDSATTPADYEHKQGTLTFAPGQSQQTVGIRVEGDVLDEHDETFSLVLESPHNATLTRGTATGTITDNDNEPSLSIADVTMLEGTGGTTTASFPVTLSAPSGRDVTVQYATSQGSAKSSADFTATSGTLVFAAGETQRTIAVPVSPDALNEDTETFTVALSGQQFATVSRGTATGTITDDDGLPSLSVADVTVTEGAAGTTKQATFTVTLAPPSGRTVDVNWAATAGTAASPADFMAASGALSFAAGETTKTVSLDVKGDDLDEDDETFSFTLSNERNATLARAQATGTITDDDPLPVASVGDVGVVEGTGGQKQAVFPITLNAPSGRSVSVNYSTAPGTASSPADFTATNGTVTFAAGETSKTVAVNVATDALDEPDESFSLQLSDPANANLGQAVGVGTISDDDDPPNLTVNDVSVTEPDGAATAQATFTLSLSAPSGRAVTVGYSSADFTARAPGDYTGITNGSVTIPAGQSAATVAVTVKGDALNEINEQFHLNVTSADFATVADAQGIGTITDNDPQPSLSVNDVTVAEGNSGNGTATFTVTLSAPSGRTVSVDYRTVAGTATAGVDYVHRQGTLTFAEGVTSQTVAITLPSDTIDEPDEDVFLDLESPSAATIARARGTATITDDDPEPSVSIGDASVTEGTGGATTATFPVTLSGPSGRTVTVAYATAPGTAIAPSDYASASGSISFGPGETAKAVSVAIVTDALDEEDTESFSVQLSGPQNATPGTMVGIGTISDDDALPAVSVNDISMTETNAGSTHDAVFTISLSAVSGRAVTVGYSTADLLAKAPGDYTAVSGGSITIPAGSVSATVPVAVKGDDIDEPDETLALNLTSASPATISRAQGVGTILDNDAPPELRVTDVTVPEAGGNAVFTVSLSGPSGFTVTAQYATAPDTATAPADYTTRSGSLTFAPGETAKTVSVPVANDALDEIDERFFLNLTSPSAATIADGQGFATITDDDEPPSVSAADVSVVEGTGGAKSVTFALNLSAPSGRVASVEYRTLDGTAVAPADYTALASTVTFQPGETQKLVSVSVETDSLDEDDEHFDLELRSPTAVTIADDRARATIVDDDGLPALSVQDVPVAEGATGATTPMTFTVTLAPAAGRSVSVDWSTGGGSASDGADFTAASGSLSFAAGETQKTVTVGVRGDNLDEDDETINLTLANPVNADLSRAQAVGTITDDDPLPVVSIGDRTVAEGTGGATTASFPVTLSAPSGRTVTVAYATAPGTATSPADFTAAGGTVSFAAGETSKTVSVNVAPDALDEADTETFSVQLSSQQNATLGQAVGIGTITDDDALPGVSVNDVSVTEPDGADTVAATFTISLDAVSGRAVTVSHSTADFTAKAPADYVPVTNGSVTIPAGQPSATVTVTVKGDALNELNEQFDLNLTSADSASITRSKGVATINDTDPLPSLVVNDQTVTEGNTGNQTATFTVSLSAPSGRTVTVDYRTVAGTATAGADYVHRQGTLTFGEGITTQTVEVSVPADTLDEPDETFFVDLDAASGATVADSRGQATITDDDDQPTVSVGDVDMTEGTGGQKQAIFPLTLSAPSGRQITIGYRTVNGTATAPSDFAAKDATISIPAGQTSGQIAIDVVTDNSDEDDETFDLELKNPQSVTVADGLATAIVRNDDPKPDVTIADVTVQEGDTQPTPAGFVISLSAPSGRPVTVTYRTADGTARAPGDYTAIASGQVTIPAGDSSVTVPVQVQGDGLSEASETFFLDLQGATSANLVEDKRGQATITDNDPLPTVSVNDVTTPEGDSGTRDATFTVTLSAVAGRDVTVNYAAQSGSATDPADYGGVSGQLTFAEGETSKSVTVQVKGDVLDEADADTYFLNLSAPSGAALAKGQGVGTITDDDPTPTASIGDVTVGEGANGQTTNAQFQVALSAVSGREVKVDYSTAPGTATAGTDYSPVSGTLTIPAGQPSGVIAVPVKGDALDELDEAFTVTIANPQSTTIVRATGTGTITDDDPTPDLTVADVSVTEGTGAQTTPMTFTVSLSAPSGRQVTVDYATENGNATATADYAAATGTLTFAPGQTQKTVTVNIVADALNELDETLKLRLSNPFAAGLPVAEATGTIRNDDAEPTISIADKAVVEGTGGTKAMDFDVDLSAPSGRTVRVAYATAPGTATSPADYAAAAGTLEFAPGETRKQVTVTVQSDALDEVDESFSVALTSPEAASIARAGATGTIQDDDPEPSITVDDPTPVQEGNTGQQTVTFKVTLSAPSGKAVGVDYATSNGSATSADYVPANGTLTFAPGQTQRTVAVQVIGDTLDEDSETFNLDLANPSNATIADARGVATITDDDAEPQVSTADRGVVEGTGGQTEIVFPVTLSAPSGRTVTVQYATAPGVATSPTDYTHAQGTLTFAAGETQKSVTVSVVPDSLDEDDTETFSLQLSGPGNATIGTGVAVGTITDDDAPPTLSVNDRTTAEGVPGDTTPVVFTISLSQPSGRAVSVDYATEDVTATAPADYTAVAGRATIPAGASSTSVSVDVKGDALNEIDETFRLKLSALSSATFAKDSGTATITNDDPVPTLSVADTSVTEGNAGDVTMTFTVSLSAPSGRTVTASYATTDGTATSPADYDARTGSVTFAPGVTSQTVAVTVHGDVLDEADADTMLLDLSNPNAAATIARPQAIGTITDDDAMPALAIDDVSANEGNAGTQDYTFTVSLSAPSGRSVGVDWATADATAVAPSDYTGAGARLTFAAGETSKTVKVVVKGDTVHEPNETFKVLLSGASNAVVADGEGIGGVVNDDALPTVSVNDPAVSEGDANTTPAVFTVSLSNPSSQAVAVDYATADLSATAGEDYVAKQGTVTIPAGSPSATVQVDVKGDALDEINEQFDLNLSNPSASATLGDAQGRATITDDDATPSLAIDDVTVTEGDNGTKDAEFTISLSAPSGQEVRVSYATAPGTATAPADFTAIPLTQVVFARGETTKKVVVKVAGDLLDEPDETFDVNLSAPVNATIAKAKGVGTITDDDPTPALTIDDVTLTEGDSGSKNFNFAVKLSAPSGRTVRVDYATVANTATTPSDFAPLNGQLTFAPGETSKTVEVPVTGDRTFEPDETFFVQLSAASNADLAGTGRATGTILNDDPTPAAAIDDVRVSEGNSGLTSASFTVSLTNRSHLPVSVDYATQDVTATSPADYTARSGTATVPAGQLTERVNIEVKGDTMFEPDETFRVDLTRPQNGTLDDATGVATIENDDAQPQISVSDISVSAEGDTGQRTAEFTLSLRNPSHQPVTVDYTTADGNAKAPADYETRSGTATFTSGQVQRTVSVPIQGDVLNEDNETFQLRLSNPANGTIARDVGTATIVDDDLPPTLAITDASIDPEGDSGFATARFEVRLCAAGTMIADPTVPCAPVASGRDVEFAFATQDDTATAPEDYTSVQDDRTIAAGQTAESIEVQVARDVLDDLDNEKFHVVLSGLVNASHATYAPSLNRPAGRAVGTIVDDDATPTVSIASATIDEGPTSGGSTQATPVMLELELSSQSGRTVSVDVATADGTATAGSDYGTLSQTVAFDRGETRRNVTVEVIPDEMDEPDESFEVRLSQAAGATATNAATVTIRDDDAKPSISIGSVRSPEGNGGNTQVAVPVTLTNATQTPFAVDYSVADGSAGAGSDYTASSGRLNFAPGETEKQIAVSLTGDLVAEPEESFSFTLDSVTPATAVNIAGATGTVTIGNDDSDPAVSVGDARVTEGTGSDTQAVFPVTLAGRSSRDVTVSFRTGDGSATAGVDYVATSGTLRIPAGGASGEIAVTVTGDPADEPDESFSVVLANPSQATIGTGSGTGTILDDDVPPQAGPPAQTPRDTPTVPEPEPEPEPDVSTKLLRSSSGATRVEVACSPDAAESRCRGTVSLSITETVSRREAPNATASAKRKTRKTRTIKVGAQRYSLRRGEKKTIVVKLSKTGQKLLKRNKRLRVAVTVTTADGVTTTVGASTIKLAKPASIAEPARSEPPPSAAPAPQPDAPPRGNPAGG